MKVLQIAPYFTPFVGGQERYVHGLSKYLVKFGNTVNVVTSNYPRSEEFDDLDGIKVRRYRCLSRPMRNPISPEMFGASENIEAYDVIHTHNEHAFSALVASHLSERSGVPFVLTCHGRLTFGNKVLDSFEKMYMATIARHILRKADAVCVNSPLDREFISEVSSIDRSSIREVHNAVDPERLSENKRGPVREDIRSICELGDLNILFVGSLIRRKGVGSLIRAMKRIFSAGSDMGIHLIMVGEGEEKQNILKMIADLGIEDRVHIVGQVTDPELAYLYSSASMLALPSLSEVCPTVVLEAMYFGLPVVTTDIPGIRDHFKGTAWLVPPMDDEKLAESMMALAKDHRLSDWMRSLGRELILSRYTWDKVARDYQTIYCQVSGGEVPAEQRVPAGVPMTIQRTQ